jgi:hypothetical protein
MKIEIEKNFEVYTDPKSAEATAHRLKKIHSCNQLTRSKQYACVCCKFQKDGILWSHVLRVMLQLNIKQIPQNYIIYRWRKNEKEDGKKHTIFKGPAEKIMTLD